jgi:hypothetical protein
MPETVTCPHCKHAARVPDQAAGKTAVCPSCRKPFGVPQRPPQAIPVGQVAQQQAVSPPRPPAAPSRSWRFAVLVGGVAALLLAVVAVVWVVVAQLGGSPPTAVAPASNPAGGSAGASPPGGRVEPIKPAQEDGPPIVLTVEALCADYRANPISARNRYRGKLLQLTGTVKEVREHGKQGARLEFSVHLKSEEFYLERVAAYFEDGQLVADLRPGHEVTFVGRGGDYFETGRLAEVRGCRPVSK